jgi:hypothetical protein
MGDPADTCESRLLAAPDGTMDGVDRRVPLLRVPQLVETLSGPVNNSVGGLHASSVPIGSPLSRCDPPYCPQLAP